MLNKQTLSKLVVILSPEALSTDEAALYRWMKTRLCQKMGESKVCWTKSAQCTMEETWVLKNIQLTVLWSECKNTTDWVPQTTTDISSSLFWGLGSPNGNVDRYSSGWKNSSLNKRDYFLPCPHNEEWVGGRKGSSKRGKEERKEEGKERQKWAQRGKKREDKERGGKRKRRREKGIQRNLVPFYWKGTNPNL